MALTVKPSVSRPVGAPTTPIQPDAQQLTTTPPAQTPPDAFVDGRRSTVDLAKTTQALKDLEGTREFQKLDPAVQQQLSRSLSASSPVTAAKLEAAKALIGSDDFRALSSTNQKLAIETLQRGGFNPTLGKSLAGLMHASGFRSAKEADQTSMLSQARNYPNTASIGNLERLVGKQWFAAQSHEDKQRSLKTIAYMSQPNRGDRTILNNTLEKLLGPDAKLDIEWADLQGLKAGHAVDSDTLQLEKGNVPANDSPGAPGLDYLANNIVPHEVNHLLSNYTVENNYKFVENEYRGWYVGFQAQNNRPPTRAEAAEYWKRSYIDGAATGIYGGTASGVRLGPEAGKMNDLVSKSIGVRVDPSNFYDVLTGYAKNGSNTPYELAPPPPGNVDNR